VLTRLNLAHRELTQPGVTLVSWATPGNCTISWKVPARMDTPGPKLCPNIASIKHHLLAWILLAQTMPEYRINKFWGRARLARFFPGKIETRVCVRKTQEQLAPTSENRAYPTYIPSHPVMLCSRFVLVDICMRICPSPSLRPCMRMTYIVRARVTCTRMLVF
jgi:hypothetical protein